MKTVLVIEDDPHVARLLTAVLWRAGYEVTAAADGRAGIERFLAWDPDLVITDLVMTGMEGIEIILKLRSLSARVPIVAMSGGGRRGTCDLLGMAAKLGASAVLAKPFSNDELLAVVEHQLSLDGWSLPAWTAVNGQAAC
jgi:CheY-like chemotaxis protein